MRTIRNETILILNDIEWYYLEKYLNNFYGKFDIYKRTKHWFDCTLEIRYEETSWCDEDQVNTRMDKFIYLTFDNAKSCQQFIGRYKKHTKEKRMRLETQKFFDVMQQRNFVDITHFWNIPHKEILDEVLTVPDEFWRRPFNADSDQVERMHLDDSESVNYYPGADGKLIEAHGWKSLCFLNETGDSKDQISRFPPIFNTAKDYRATLDYFLKNRKWTNVAHFSPTLLNFFEEQIYPYMHVGQIFVTRLDGGGIITEHSDIPEESKKYLNGEKVHMFDMLNTFNLSLNAVPSAYAVFNNKIMPSYKGCCMLTNVGKSHWVVNMNRQPLYKIIWQGIYKKSFRDLVMENYNAGKFV